MENQDERRKNGGLSDEQVEAIKQAILDSIFQEIGRSVFRKAIWITGAILFAVGTWLHGAGYIKFPGAE